MRFQIKPAGDGKFRWELHSDNGEVVGKSAQTYSKFELLQRIKLIQANARHAAIEGLRE